jgi:FKBP-type peptidyl-prolyl cis-trans isomerase FklB
MTEMTMKKVVLTLCILAVSLPTAAAEQAALSVSERYSYAMGVRLGQLLKGQGIRQLDSKAFAAAIDDVLLNRPLRLDDNEMVAAIREQQRVFANQREQRAQTNLVAGREFLAKNAGNADVVVLPSGLQYRVLDSGTGAQPGAGDRVRVHYHGTLLDGTVFDSSVDRGQPVDFSLTAVIPGFRESISRMRVGDRWQVFLPSALAYGEEGAGTAIGPNETLTFEIQLLDIVQ